MSIKAFVFGVVGALVVASSAASAQGDNRVLSLPSRFAAVDVGFRDLLKSPNNTGEMTIEFWIRREATYPFGRPFSMRGCSCSGITIQANLDNDVGRLRVEIGGVSDVGTVPFSLSAWQHFAIVWTRAEGKIQVFQNGKPGAEYEVPTTGDIVYCGTASLRFGSQCDSGLVGAMDNIRYWAVARTLEQVRANMMVQFSPEQAAAQSGLLGSWTFEDGTPSDGTGNNPVGSLVSDATVSVESIPSFDLDNDGVPDGQDNCPAVSNPSQADCNNNGVGEACETFTDCNDNMFPDSCEIASGAAQDCNANGIPDSCEIATDPSTDCNSNSVPDSCDIASGTSADADSNGVPDSCQPDCNLNGLPDGFDIASGLISDLNADGTPDDCQGASMIRRVSPNLGAPSGATARVWIVPELLPSESNVTITVDLRGDLNGNSEWADVVLNNGKPRRFFQSDGGICPELPDHAEIVLSRDEWNALVGTDGLLTVRVECPPTVDGSECKDQGLTLLSLAYVGVTPAGDCDGNQRLDVAETYDGSAPDCNSNMVPDRCDIAGGTSQDCNANEVPDACELTATPSIDCDRNGSIDSCDLVTGGTSVDCDQNGRIDSCQVSETPGTDCNGNLRPDPCDIASGTSADVDRNGTPDDCQTISVPDQYDGIQAAIDAAPATEMRIISVAPGTYSGPINLLGKPIRLIGAGGAAVTTISGTGGQSQSVVRAISGEPAISLIKGFTIRGGVTGSPLPSLPSANCGGGLLVFNSQTSIQDCTFTDNVSSFGGGAYLLGHAGSITNCTFATNIAQGYGGGLQLFDSSTAISGCSFTDNVAVTAGAGLHMVSNTPTLVNCTITGNDCNDQGGGISWDPVNPGSVMTLQGTTVTGNIADVIGGGLYVYPSGVAAETQLVGTTVCGNSVRNISGPYQADVTSQVCDCRADLSADGFVNGVDLAIVLSNWGVVGSSADLTGDDTVDGADLGIILAAWGTCPSS